MKITILIDNISNNELLKEWGLSIYIEYNGKKFLLDTGHSEMFEQNARSLGINLADIDYGVLSHGHYDHSDGLDKFFELNDKAKFYVQKNIGENCYHHYWWIFNSYIGLKKGTLKKYADRFVPADFKQEICPGVYLLAHSTPGLEKLAKPVGLYVRENGRLVPDSFKHEQSLIFETEQGLVIFNSCSHGGADNIIREVTEAFPGKQIYGIIGGFHLSRLSDDDVLAFAHRVKNTGIEHVITGHCTGQRAFEILKQELGEKVQQMYSGMEIVI